MHPGHSQVFNNLDVKSASGFINLAVRHVPLSDRKRLRDVQLTLSERQQGEFMRTGLSGLVRRDSRLAQRGMDRDSERQKEGEREGGKKKRQGW